MKTRIFTLIVSLFITAMAFPAVVDGIEYNFSSSTAEVAKPINKIYSGDIIIPASVEYKGNKYRVTSIHKDAFWFSGITSIYIPATITNIYDETFRGCDRLTSVTFAGNNLTYIGRSAFLGCSKLTSITIPNCKIQPYSELWIAAKAFCYCESLTSIDIPNNAVIIGGDAFYGCKSLTSVTINSNNIIGIGDPFEGCTSLTSIKWNVIECEDDYCSQTPFYSIKDQINNITFGSNIKSIPNYLCCGLSNLTSIDIPSNVTSIGNSSFEGCTSLTSIDIPSNVTSIGNRSFAGCTSLTSIDIPNKVTSIGNSAFSGCSSLTSITIPNSVTKIGNFAFYECSSLTSITIPNNVTSIGTETFYKCSSLTSVTIGSSVNYIATDAFNYCPELANIVVNSNNGVFNSKNKCNAIIFTSENKLIKGGKNTIIPSDVRIIGEYAFHNSSLTSITIPNSVASIGDDAFYNCSSLSSVHISDIAAWCNIDFEDYASNPLYYAKNLYLNGEEVTNLVIPEGVTYIRNYAFCYCSSLKSISIPNSVTSIGGSAFSNCSSLSSISIPNRVTSIGRYAFYKCSSINELIVKATNPPSLANYAFDNVPKSIQVKVPCNSISKYQNSYGWEEFTNFIEITPILTINVNNASMGVASITKQNSCEDNIAQVEAKANAGYKFVRWSDGNTENPRKITVTKDMTLTAEFAKEEVEVDIENILITSANVYSSNGRLHVEGAETDYYVLDMAGRLIYSGRDTELQLPRGVYVVNVGGEVQKVVL